MTIPKPRPARSRRRYRTIDELPLFADDEMLGEAILGVDRRREFIALAKSLEPVGLPRFNPLYKGRYVPGVRAFFETEYGPIAHQQPKRPR